MLITIKHKSRLLLENLVKTMNLENLEKNHRNLKSNPNLKNILTSSKTNMNIEMMKTSATNTMKIHVNLMKFAHGARVVQFLLLATLLKTQKNFHQQYSHATIFLTKSLIHLKTKAHGDIPEK